jgi:putative zinc finger protein
MEQLPKIVRERLQAGPAGEHPDSDLLTAFLEQSLSERERARILEHLSGCRECREVVSLAAPEPAALSTRTRPAPPVSSWLRWPVLRWGALAACVVVVSAVGFVYHSRVPHPPFEISMNQRSVLPPGLPKQVEAEKSASSAATETIGTRSQAGDASRTAPARNKALAASRAKGEVKQFEQLAKQAPAAPPAVHSYRDRFAPNVEADQVTVAARPSEKLQAVPPAAYQGTAGIAPSRTAPGGAAHDERGQSYQILAQVVRAAPEMPVPEVKSDKPKAEEGQKLPKPVDTDVSETQTAFATQTLASTAASTKARGLLRDLKSTRWSLSDDGLPQRSFNAGNTWEKIQVDHTTGFRALSAEGFEVWVGGRNGVLYHSTDLGMHWTRVTPTIDGAVLSADIIRIEFSDSLHGKLTTAENQTVATSDGGKSWHKQ